MPADRDSTALIASRARPRSIATRAARFLFGALALSIGIASVFPGLGHGSVPGEAAPSLEGVEWAQGDPVHGWQDLHGKITLVEFWATWCAPCMETMPHVRELVAGSDDVEVIWVASDSPEDVARFLESESLPGRVAVNPARDMLARFGEESLPTSAVVDRDGILRLVDHPFRVTRDTLERIARGEFPEANAGLRRPEHTLFEASIRETTTLQWSIGTTPVSVDLRGVTVREILEFGYTQSPARVLTEGVELPPSRYDATARAPDGERSRIGDILAAAIEHAFGVDVSRAPRELDVLTLSSGEFKGRPLKERSSGLKLTGDGISGQGSFEQVCHYLEYELGVPVVNGTGLEGAFDLTLDWTRGDRESLTRALAAIGLTLKPERSVVDVIVIAPVPNSGEVPSGAQSQSP